MVKSHLALVAPTTINGTVNKAGPPKRRRNAEVRSREYLTDAEVNRLISAAGENRNGHRDATMILVAYRHGLRPAEVGQVLARADLGVEAPRRWSSLVYCPINSCRRHHRQMRFCHGFSDLSSCYCPEYEFLRDTAQGEEIPMPQG